MIRRRLSKGQKLLFMALMVSHSKSSQPQPKASCEVGELLAHRDVAHQPVVGVDGDPEAQPAQQADRVLGDGVAHAGVDVRGGAHLERHPPVADERGQPAELDLAVGVDRDVVDDAHAVAEPLGAADLQRLPDRRQPEGLAGVDGDVGVGLGDGAEGVEVAARRVAGLAAGDVEADDALVAVAQGDLGDLLGAGRRGAWR